MRMRIKKHEMLRNRGALMWLKLRSAFRLTICILAAWISLQAEVLAAGDSKAEQLITEGLDLRRAGQDSDALSKFAEAHRIAPTPRAAAQWGLCLQAVGRWSEADVRLSEALKAKKDPWIIKNRSILKESLEQVKTKVARVEVNGGPEGATVLVNGYEVGRYPLAGAVPVNAGNLDIEVVKPGFKRGYRSITIAGGQYERLVIRLEEQNDNAGSTGSNTSLPMPANSMLPPESIVNGTTTASVDQRPIYRSPWAWALVGALVIGGTIAVILVSGSGGTTGPIVNQRGVFD
jgi:tetratricopeptide (TPR) repeat protein